MRKHIRGILAIYGGEDVKIFDMIDFKQQKGFSVVNGVLGEHTYNHFRCFENDPALESSYTKWQRIG